MAQVLQRLYRQKRAKKRRASQGVTPSRQQSAARQALAFIECVAIALLFIELDFLLTLRFLGSLAGRGRAMMRRNPSFEACFSGCNWRGKHAWRRRNRRRSCGVLTLPLQ
eukprot:SAG25_NODE_604_length_6583_cov_11.931431_4_plen_110_part_00